ncbi:trypco2 family protein [Streptomyces gamaensis]|uniref:Trypco2 family protein n=1 Tax=Streptomyces gamaensis TaxID=1763542 RepID=A0ABW0Z6I0_9ACTN
MAKESPASPIDGVELADAVQAVREGLAAAAERGAGQSVTFEVGEISMEFSVEIRRDVEAGGRVKAWIVGAGAEASRGSARVHKVAFTLSPKDAATGGTTIVGNERPGSLSRFGSSADR